MTKGPIGMTAKLVHYASKPIVAAHSMDQPTEADHKPKGLWLSDDACEHNWRAWCEGEGWGLDRLVFSHDVRLSSAARILHLSSAGDIDAFDEEYGQRRGRTSPRYGVHWHQVAAKYDGILITPYIWERRLTEIAAWYYGWDCASGCIWNAAAIESIYPALATVNPEKAG